MDGGGVAASVSRMKPVPGIPIDQQPAGPLARMALYGEARGERDAARDLDGVGMLCVIHVVMTRARKRGTSIATEILRRWQFSTFNENDPNRGKLLDAWKDDPVSWERADAVMDLVEGGFTSDPTGGATHYCTLELWGVDDTGRDRPRWHSRSEIDAGHTVEVYRRGHHVFAKAA